MTTTTRTPMAKRRRMINLKLNATAGVDHGANSAQMNGAEGWAVIKADGTPVNPASFKPVKEVTPVRQ